MAQGQREIAVVGVGGTIYQPRGVTGHEAISYHAEAAALAIADAGLSKRDIDGILVCEHSEDVKIAYRLAENLGMSGRAKPLCLAITNGGVAAAVANKVATWALLSGEVNYVLVVGGGGGARGRASERAAQPGTYMQGQHHFSWEFDVINGPLGAPGFYALHAKRHMHEYGTTAEQLAAVKVASSKHGALYPKTLLPQVVTVDDVLNSRYVCEPFHILDCCYPTGGGSDAYILTTAERARDLKHPPVWMLGVGQYHAGYHIGALCTGWEDGHDLIRTNGREAADQAFGEAGVERSDIDLAELYDSFTMTVLMQLEDFGFCAKGEAGPFAEGGRLELGGELPVNTNGGMLNLGQTGVGSTVMFQTEAVEQLRGEAGPRQVQDARLAVVGSVSGPMSNYGCTILARD